MVFGSRYLQTLFTPVSPPAHPFRTSRCCCLTATGSRRSTTPRPSRRCPDCARSHCRRSPAQHKSISHSELSRQERSRSAADKIALALAACCSPAKNASCNPVQTRNTSPESSCIGSTLHSFTPLATTAFTPPPLASFTPPPTPSPGCRASGRNGAARRVEPVLLVPCVPRDPATTRAAGILI